MKYFTQTIWKYLKFEFHLVNPQPNEMQYLTKIFIILGKYQLWWFVAIFTKKKKTLCIFNIQGQRTNGNRCHQEDCIHTYVAATSSLWWPSLPSTSSSSKWRENIKHFAVFAYQNWQRHLRRQGQTHMHTYVHVHIYYCAYMESVATLQLLPYAVTGHL